MLSRRHLLHLGTLGPLGLAAGLPGLARAGAGSQRRFVFVVAFGGWDVSRVLAPVLDNPVVDTEPEAKMVEEGGLSWVAHPDRPSVDALFEAHAARAVVLNGLLVPSVAHMAALSLVMTGATSGRADWPALLAAHDASAPPLPHLVLSGPSYPGSHAGVVTRTGSSGQLDALLRGTLRDWSDQPLATPAPALQALQDAALRDRIDAAAARTSDPHRVALLDAHRVALDRAAVLGQSVDTVDWTAAGTFVDQCLLGAQVLGEGLSRCVTLRYPSDWDTHALNDLYQSWHWEGLAEGLLALLDSLSALPGEGGGTLLDETTVVVVSELGRTPGRNAEDGKDHWPYTSALLLGAGLAGGQVVGGYDGGFQGQRLDPSTGAVDEAGGIDLTAEVLGATLLALADLDPGEHLPGVDVLQAVLA